MSNLLRNIGRILLNIRYAGAIVTFILWPLHKKLKKFIMIPIGYLLYFKDKER